MSVFDVAALKMYTSNYYLLSVHFIKIFWFPCPPALPRPQKEGYIYTIWQTKIFSIQRGHLLKLSHTWICTHPYTCICTSPHTCTHPYTRACIPTSTCVHMYPPTYPPPHTHTHVHRHFSPLHGLVNTSLRTRVWKSLTSSTKPSLEIGFLTYSAGALPALPARSQEGVECSTFLMLSTTGRCFSPVGLKSNSTCLFEFCSLGGLPERSFDRLLQLLTEQYLTELGQALLSSLAPWPVWRRMPSLRLVLCACTDVVQVRIHFLVAMLLRLYEFPPQ